ncbi:MAG TPA: FAD-dependent oxidoreductase [Gammaproteobacteria bacterium]|nr:FAD-dependent oxidoreductase [Gammaproteobacteria bacterium]
MSNNEYEIVVSGGGIAGLTAALTAARLGRKTLILSGAVPGGHLLSIERIDGYPGFPDGISGYELCPMTQEAAMAEGVEFAPVELVAVTRDAGGFSIEAETGTWHTRSLIMATGAHLKRLSVPGEAGFTGKGVSHCASCDGPMLKGKTAVVVGGGDSALQESLTLAAHAASVIVLQKEAQLTGQPVYQRLVTEQSRISVRCGMLVEEILGAQVVSGVRVRDLATGATSDLPAEAVFIYIGMAPNSGLVTQFVKLDENAQIPVDAKMRTTVPGLLAAGLVRSGAAGRAVASAGDGAAAAASADSFLRDGLWRQ